MEIWVADDNGALVPKLSFLWAVASSSRPFSKRGFNPAACHYADVTGVLLPVLMPCLRRSRGG
jgi:hypothetical protein